MISIEGLISRRGISTSIGWLGLGALVAVAGCGESRPSIGPIFAVKGKVLLANGKPLKSGHIYFERADGLSTSHGAIGPDGEYSLQTGAEGEGAPPGNYKIRLEPGDASAYSNKRKGGKAMPFPKRYLDEDNSALTAIVKAEPNTLEPFRLK
ncbi:hypothetical protein ACYOEI_04480 [Singulisphaera rosea]